jgi:hypothetical protein
LADADGAMLEVAVLFVAGIEVPVDNLVVEVDDELAGDHTKTTVVDGSDPFII